MEGYGSKIYKIMPAMGVVVTGVLIFIFRLYNSKLLVTIILGLSSFLVFGCYIRYCLYNTRYEETKNGFIQSDLFKNKRVLIFVPHQDDEVNMAGATIENMMQANCEVYVAYYTNGDWYGKGRERLRETIKCLSRLGVDESKIIFLGYGDSCFFGNKHIYNQADFNKEIKSRAGYITTYGLKTHPDFHTYENGSPAAQTRKNMLEDISSIIEKIYPDIILCSDMDEHCDHRALSMLFDEAIGRILANNKYFHPTVFKGFAYYTAYTSYDDYYSDVLASTKIPGDLNVPFHDWEERIRFPVPNKFLSYTKRANKVYRLFSIFKTQGVKKRTGRVANSDQVFWERQTTSLTYDARFFATSGDASTLSDFKLFDSDNIAQTDIRYNRGYWTPDKTDRNRTITISFNSRISCNCIVVYGNTNRENVRMSIEVIFDDGEKIYLKKADFKEGKLYINFKTKNNVEWINVSILEWSTPPIIITQVEVYKKTELNTSYIKLIDSNDNFIYICPVKAGTISKFRIYSYPVPIDKNEYVILAPDGVDAWFDSNNSISVIVHKKGKYRFKLAHAYNRTIYDEIILNTNINMRFIHILQKLETVIDSILSVAGKGKETIYTALSTLSKSTVKNKELIIYLAIFLENNWI